MSVKLLSVCVSFLVLSSTAVVHVQAANSGFNPPQQEMSAKDNQSIFDDVFPEVQKLSEARMKEMKAAEDSTAKRRINLEYSRKVSEKIRDAGLTVNEFNKMARKKAQTN